MNIGIKAVNARIAVCIIAILMPFILVISTGEKLGSYSQYFYTPAGPFFIGVLSLTCFMMFGNVNWIPSATALSLVALFPANDYPTVHNISAVIFFIISAIAMLFDNEDKWMGVFMIITGPLVLFDLFVAEFILISTIATFHMRRLLRLKKLLIELDQR